MCYVIACPAGIWFGRLSSGDLTVHLSGEDIPNRLSGGDLTVHLSGEDLPDRLSGGELLLLLA